MKMLKAGLFGLLAGTALGGTASFADELVLSSWLPPRHPIVVNAIEPWADEVAKVTDGRVTVRVLKKPLGTPPAHFDMAKDGIADITYGLHSFTEDDRFNRSRLGQFSFLGDDAVANSTAFYDIYMNQLDATKEHEGTHILGLFMHGPGLLHNNKLKIEKPEDLQGLKIRVPGGYVADLIGAMGAAPLFMPSPEVYEKLSRGVIDGVAFTYEALTAFKLTDDLKYSMTVPGGIYNTTWFLVMNDAKWDAISDEDKAAIEAISGPAFSERVGKAWNDADIAATEKINEAGIELYAAPESVVDEMRDIAGGLEDKWAASLGEGFDGKAALADFRSRTGVSVE